VIRLTLRRFRSALLASALEMAAWLGRRIPLSAGQQLGRVLGSLAFYAVPRERTRALQNIALAFPEWKQAKHRAVIREMFQHLGMSLFEIFWLPNLNERTLASTTVFEGTEYLPLALEPGRGSVAFAAHCGNWEWLAAGVATLGYDVTVMAREVYDSRLNDFMVAAREKNRVKTIGRGSVSAAREMLVALRRGGFLAFLIDQNIRSDSADLLFFGRPALTPVGPAKLAIRSGATTVGVFEERRNGKHYIRIQPPLVLTRDDDAVRLTEHYTRQIEEQIRRVPEQWVWMHQRWKRRSKVKIVE